MNTNDPTSLHVPEPVLTLQEQYTTVWVKLESAQPLDGDSLYEQMAPLHEDAYNLINARLKEIPGFHRTVGTDDDRIQIPMCELCELDFEFGEVGANSLLVSVSFWSEQQFDQRWNEALRDLCVQAYTELAPQHDFSASYARTSRYETFRATRNIENIGI